MKHRISFNRLGRKSSHRKALIRNMVTSLFRHERIRTTEVKAKEVRRYAERLITRAKVDSVHNRRMVARFVQDKAVLAKLFTDIAPRFVSRPGGYTRVLKLGERRGDAASVVILELVERKVEAKPEKKKREEKKAESGSKEEESAVQE
ncbi:50S ribosomal protein L17 [Spirochaeta thermophila DSM 6578]|uniref:Large ribosomal subunit protein bL17 n=1 Tax=Winmispira thermophila (strain ATCC 700085 / DSM 6578 / Z-1203) TaxID=869211 RepID=G0G9S4_WINT7|nr:50S ribosomal protein L17 [Spirochaeta thermophila]AEJ60824.1 50S ribosomal protein L17 [Spirochaeta thermophila DSM 6578]